MSRHDIPGAWYDLSGRLSAALTVIDSISCYMPCGDAYRSAQDQLDNIGNLASAASDILKLCKADCEELERAMLDVKAA